MRLRLIVVSVFVILGTGTVAAQADSARVAMNTFMAKNPGGNASPANVSMWPNPASGSVNLYLNTIQPGDRGQCIIFNNSGNICTIAPLRNGNNRVYIGTLPEGIYFLHIRLHNNIIFAKRLIVSR